MSVVSVVSVEEAWSLQNGLCMAGSVEAQATVTKVRDLGPPLEIDEDILRL